MGLPESRLKSQYWFKNHLFSKPPFAESGNHRISNLQLAAAIGFSNTDLRSRVCHVYYLYISGIRNQSGR